MNDDTPVVTPADQSEVAQTIAYALEHRRNGKAARDFDRVLAMAAGEHVAEWLNRSGFIVCRRPPLPGHSVSYGPTGVVGKDTAGE